MSGSAIADALVTMLGATSAFGPECVSKEDYSVLERASGSALMVMPAGFENGVRTFGVTSSKAVTWRFNVEAYAKDTGDPRAVLNQVYKLADVVKAVIDADMTAQGTAKKVILSNGERPRDTYVETGGATWLPYYMTITAEDF